MSELSEEDVIKYLEECNESQDILGFCYIPEMVCSKILDLYQREKQTSHFLQSELDQANAKIIEEREKNKEIENADLTTVYMNGFYDGEKKWKDKIKELIEQLEDVLDLAEGEKNFPKYRKQALIEEIKDLQELLEERN